MSRYLFEIQRRLLPEIHHPPADYPLLRGNYPPDAFHWADAVDWPAVPLYEAVQNLAFLNEHFPEYEYQVVLKL